MVNTLTGNGAYRWQVQASDSLGNTSSWSQSGRFILNIPQAFSFAPQSNSELSTLTTSNAIVLG
ncbi:MAG: hypothetical protein WCJ39_03020 [bacterium]